MLVPKRFLPLIIVATSLLLALLLVALRKPPEKQALVVPPVAVTTIATSPKDVPVIIHSQGTLEPDTQTTLVAEVSGKILHTSPRFLSGGFFHAGEILVRIDPSDYQVSVKAAEAKLAGAMARLAQESARAKQARKDWQSVGKGKPSALVLRKPYVAEARANVRSAEAELERARRELERTDIRAPYDGLVRNKLADVGQYLTPGSPVGVVFAVRYAEVRLPISARDRMFIEVPAAGQQEGGSSVTLHSNASGQPQSYSARLVRTEGVVDEKSRLVYAVARIDDPYALAAASKPLQPTPLEFGSYVEADIHGITLRGISVIPRNALRGTNRIYSVDENQTLHIRDVEIERADSRFIFISQGLVAGERIVVSALGSPVDGMRVQTQAKAAQLAGESDPGNIVVASPE